ncbi:MAG: DUF3422 domain-containing protein [Myxococcota bacterium]|nr:DUF3422 domain-containing protein [Myxococcota bacterium]
MAEAREGIERELEDAHREVEGAPIGLRRQTVSLSNEWHARPTLQLPPPFRCSHLVELRSEASVEHSRDEFGDFCAEFGQSRPASDARFHSVRIGTSMIKWESHTEAVCHTVFVPGNGQPPFSESALDFVSEKKRRKLVDRMFLGVQIEVVRPPGDHDPYGYELAGSLLGSSDVYGGFMSARTAAVWSAFQLDARGFVRLVIVGLEDNEERLSRLLQRLLDLETYRMLAMLALPRARTVMAGLSALDPELDEVMRELAQEGGAIPLEQLLHRITSVAAKVEHIASSHAYRFAAARAYAGIVERRCSEVDEEVLGDHQRYTNFLLRSLIPAMRTCDAADRRTQDVAERAGRAARILDTMVDVIRKQQNQEILESMAQSSQTQVKLQQAVEGFSIVAISYYGLGLLSYGLKSAKVAGLPVHPDLFAGIAAPVVVAAVWLTVRSVRRRLTRRGGGEGS